jgi:ankyrin repeat protein
MTALHYACLWNDYSKVALLLSYGADPHLESFPLIHNRLDIIKALTCDELRSYSNNLDILHLLLHHGCDPNYFVEQAMHNRHLDVLKLLIDYGVDQNRLCGWDPDLDDYIDAMCLTIKEPESPS